MSSANRRGVDSSKNFVPLPLRKPRKVRRDCLALFSNKPYLEPAAITAISGITGKSTATEAGSSEVSGDLIGNQCARIERHFIQLAFESK